jgi:hypothetical protein
MSELTHWDSFYVILGSAAGGLIGLQFVVMTLIAERPLKGIAEAGQAFASPTIVHFATVLFLSLLLRAPWASIVPAAVIWGLLGVVGVVYLVIVALRIRKQQSYAPVLEDLAFHLALPAIAYLALLAGALFAPRHEVKSFFAVGAAATLLLFVGIHNAWDSVSFFVYVRPGEKKNEKDA